MQVQSSSHSVDVFPVELPVLETSVQDADQAVG
jgi:hypothetical protein